MYAPLLWVYGLHKTGCCSSELSSSKLSREYMSCLVQMLSEECTHQTHVCTHVFTLLRQRLVASTYVRMQMVAVASTSSQPTSSAEQTCTSHNMINICTYMYVHEQHHQGWGKYELTPLLYADIRPQEHLRTHIFRQSVLTASQVVQHSHHFIMNLKQLNICAKNVHMYIIIAYTSPEVVYVFITCFDRSGFTWRRAHINT